MKIRKGLGAFVLLALLFTQFNNCGSYSSNGSTDLAQEINCTVPSCVIPTLDRLSVNINIANGQGTFYVAPNVADFNVGGVCNEGGYPYNIVKWELWYSGTRVRTSDNPGSGSPTDSRTTGNSQCVNGRFMLYVNLNNLVPADPVNRTGLANPQVGTYTSYDFYVQIYGQDSQGGLLQTNSVTARSYISLAHP